MLCFRFILYGDSLDFRVVLPRQCYGMFLCCRVCCRRACRHSRCPSPCRLSAPQPGRITSMDRPTTYRTQYCDQKYRRYPSNTKHPQHLYLASKIALPPFHAHPISPYQLTYSCTRTTAHRSIHHATHSHPNLHPNSSSCSLASTSGRGEVLPPPLRYHAHK